MCDSPAPGRWEVDAPYGWEDDPKEAEYVALMAENDPDYRENPVLAAMRLEAEEEQDREWEESTKSPEQYAKIMKETFNTKKTLNFDTSLSNSSIQSYETDDFMSQPDNSIMELHGEVAYIQAYEQKANKHKKLRKLLAQPLTPANTPSPKKVSISMDPTKLGAAAKQYVVAKAQASSPAPKMKTFAMPFLASSDSEDDGPPLPSFNKLAIAGKKNFFAPVHLHSPPASARKASKKAGFFSAVVASDSDEEIPVPTLTFKPKLCVSGKKFFAAPSTSSPAKLSPFKKAGLAAVAAARQEMFTIKALNSKLHDRLEYLQKVQIGQKLYSQSSLLPENVNAFLVSRKKAPGYLELAVDIENLIINAMITKIEAGVTQVNPSSLLVDAKSKLKDKYKLLAENLTAISNM